MTLDNTVSNNQKCVEMKTLKAIFDSEEYKKDLEDLSLYAAHIIQERPMLYFLAKYLSTRGFKPILEKKDSGYAYDLAVNSTKIEAKFYYEGDIKRRLETEMNKVKWDINSLRKKLEKLKEKNRGTSWNMALAIIKDIFDKNPEIFILIIVSRDLRKIKKTEPDFLKHICWSKYEIKYNEQKHNEEYGFDNKRILKLVNRFLDQIKKIKPFESDYLKINITNKMFPSSYHIYFCDFNAL